MRRVGAGGMQLISFPRSLSWLILSILFSVCLSVPVRMRIHVRVYCIYMCQRQWWSIRHVHIHGAWPFSVISLPVNFGKHFSVSPVSSWIKVDQMCNQLLRGWGIWCQHELDTLYSTAHETFFFFHFVTEHSQELNSGKWKCFCATLMCKRHEKKTNPSPRMHPSIILI